MGRRIKEKAEKTGVPFKKLTYKIIRPYFPASINGKGLQANIHEQC